MAFPKACDDDKIAFVAGVRRGREKGSDSRLCVKALLESKISQGFEGFEDFICTGLYGFVPSSISSGTVRYYNRSQNLFSINP